MDALQFAYWLQGFAELSGDTPPTEAQWKSIREHVALVFQKVTPPVQAIPQLGADWQQRMLTEVMRTGPVSVRCDTSDKRRAIC